MSIESVRENLAAKGLADRILEFEESSATVAEAARDLGCEPARIAKTMAFVTGEGPVLVVMAGDAKVDNPRYKAQFGMKAKMIPPAQVEQLVGHAVGGVCPFGVNEGVRVYLDESLRRFEVVYPAAGTARSAVRLRVPELEASVDHFAGWINIGKGWGETPEN